VTIFQKHVMLFGVIALTHTAVTEHHENDKKTAVITDTG